jgi:Fe-Mn family superoxide dismutase
MRAQLTAATTSVQGVGWGALAWDPMGQRLMIEQIYDHQGNIGQAATPLLVIDAWEHAFYLQYKNVKADWVEAFWNIVNWEDVDRRFQRARLAELVA